MKDKIEYYVDDSLFASVKSAMVPPVGSYISILQKTYMVSAVSYALDHSHAPSGGCMRANVDLSLVEGEQHDE